MKKISIFSCLFLIFICSAFAYDFSNVSLSTQGVDLSKEEESWLISMVAAKLTENLSTYADINIIDTVNKKDIINAQKREEINGNVQAGNLKSATYIAFLKITKTFSGYTLNLALTDIETGDILAPVVTKGKYKKAENLYNGYGSAVNEITIRFCDALGIVLEDYEREVLMNGEDVLSDYARSQYYERNVERYNQRIRELNKELESINNKSSLEANKRRIDLENKKAKAEANLRTATARKERAEREAKKQAEDELRSKNRTSAQNDKIESKIGNIDDTVEALRKKNRDESSLLEIVTITEMKKKSYLEMKDTLESNLEISRKEIEEKKANAIKAIDDEKFMNSELSHNKPTKKALENREKRKAAALRDIDSKDVAQMNNFEAEITSRLNKLYDEIQDDYEDITPKMISSLNGELIVTYESYDGDLGGWPLNIAVQIDDELLLETTSFISYSDVTGKRIVDEYDSNNPDEYNDFNDTVDFYEFFFSQGKQILTYTLYYYIKPSKRSLPSSYDIIFDKFCFYDTEELKIRGNNVVSEPKGSLVLKDSVVSKQFYPIYDIRTDAEIEEDEAAEAQRQRDLAAAEVKRQKEIEDAAKAEEKRLKDQQMRAELQEQKRIQNEEKARAREEKVAEMKDGFDNFFSDVGDMFVDGINYHASNADTSIINIKFEGSGGDVSGAGFEISYAYGFGEHIFAGTSLDVIFTENSEYFGLSKTNKGSVVNDLIEVGYKHSLSSLFDSLFYCDWEIFSCPDMYYTVGLGWSVANFDKNSPSGSFLMGIQVGIESTLLDAVTFISETEVNMYMGNQKLTNLAAAASINFNIGLGYRF